MKCNVACGFSKEKKVLVVWIVQRSLAEPQELFQPDGTPGDEGWSRAGAGSPGLSVHVLHKQVNPRCWERQAG